MTRDEFIQLTEPFYELLLKQGELRDEDVINDRQLIMMQHAVVDSSIILVRFRLLQEAYRKKWEYKDTYRADKWAHKDYVREMRISRRNLIKSRRDAAKAVREEERRQRKLGKTAVKSELLQKAEATENNPLLDNGPE